MPKEPEDIIAELKQENADLKAARAKDEQSLKAREADNKDLRDKLKTAQEHATQLEQQLPPDGSIIIKPDEAAELTQYRELGPLADLTAKVAERDDAIARATQLERASIIEKAAAIAGFKPHILEEQLRDLKIKPDRDKDGNSTYLVMRDGKPALSVTDWAEQERADYLPALRLDPTKDAPRAPTGAGYRPAEPRKIDPAAIAEEKRKSGDYHPL